MPFGDYTDFQDCLNKNKGKENPSAYCGAIKHKVEGAKLKTKIATLKLKVIKTRLAAEGDPSTSQQPGSPDGPHYKLKKFKSKGYPFKHEKIGILKLASTNGKFAKYYLIDGYNTNGNGWGVTNDSIPNNIQTFVDRPFVVTAKSWVGDWSPFGDTYDHPFIPSNNLKLIERNQERYRVGNMTKVGKDHDGRWYVMIAINQKYQHMPLPPFCSPAIYQLDPHEPEGSITKWIGLHLAGLNENPAYGPRVAILKGTCTGSPDQCTHQFKMAKKQTDCICPVMMSNTKIALKRLKKKFKYKGVK